MLISLPNHRQIFTPKCKQENLHIYLSHLINLKTPKKQSNLLNWSNTGQKGKLKLLMLDAEKCIWQKLYCLRLSFDFFFFLIIISQNSKSEPVIRLYCTQLESSSKTKLQCSLIVYIIMLVLCIKNKTKQKSGAGGGGGASKAKNKLNLAGCSLCLHSSFKVYFLMCC